MKLSVLGAMESSATPLVIAQANRNAATTPTRRPSQSRPMRYTSPAQAMFTRMVSTLTAATLVAPNSAKTAAKVA
jgi:hypothetical protein